MKVARFSKFKKGLFEFFVSKFSVFKFTSHLRQTLSNETNIENEINILKFNFVVF